MVRTFHRRACQVLTLAVLLPAPARALADGETETERETPDTAVTPVGTASPPLRLVSGNVLGVVSGRFGLAYQGMLAAHHAILIGGHATLVPHLARGTDQVLGFGGQLGYRFYSAPRGPVGFFVGPSVLAGRYSWEEGGNETNTGSLGHYAVAADVGWAALMGSHLVVAVVGGAQYSWVNGGDPLGSGDQVSAFMSPLPRNGVSPRVALELGFAF